MRFRSLLAVLLGGSVAVTVANLLRDILLAAEFGAGREADILFLAMSIPLFAISVGANAFRSVSVPALSVAHAAGEDFAKVVARRFILLAAGGAVVTMALLALASGLLLVTPLPGLDAGYRQVFARFLAAILPMYFLAGLVELWQGPFQAWKTFLAPSLLRLGLPCGIMLGCWLVPGTTLLDVAIGGAAGTLAAVGIGLALLRRLDLIPFAGTRPLPPDLARSTRANFAAIVGATCITYANPLVDQWVASFAGPGSVAMLGYAGRITGGVITLVATALGQSLLVHYSRYIRDDNRAAVKTTYAAVIEVAAWLGSAVALGTWLLSDFAVSLFYERGQFTAETSTAVAMLVDVYAIQFPIYWMSVACFTLIAARSMNRVFLQIGGLLFAVNAASDLALVRLAGLPGVALTTSIVYALSGLLLHRALRQAGHVDLAGRDLARIAMPLGLLVLGGVVIRTFQLRIAPDGPPAEIAAAVALLALFGALALPRVWRIFRQVR
ncbi:MAG: hypothetical protein J0M16_00810 [Gammaproteobacteria bacterium]|nr:hypothetical protein [Gammaproteobacteria bacterium]